MDDISSNFDTVVSTDGTREGVERLGLSHHLASSKDNIGTLPAHGNNRGASHVLDQTTEERFVGKVSIVLLQMSFSTLHHLHADELESPGFESLDDFTGKSSLDAIRLYGDESTFGRHGDEVCRC